MYRPWTLSTCPRLPIMVQFYNEPKYLLVVGKDVSGVFLGNGAKVFWNQLFTEYQWVVDQVNQIRDICGEKTD